MHSTVCIDDWGLCNAVTAYGCAYKAKTDSLCIDVCCLSVSAYVHEDTVCVVGIDVCVLGWGFNILRHIPF